MMTQNRQKLSRVILISYILRATDGADFPNIDEKNNAVVVYFSMLSYYRVDADGLDLLSKFLDVS